MGLWDMLNGNHGKRLLGAAFIGLAAVFLTPAIKAQTAVADTAQVVGGPVVMRRLTQHEYRNIIRDVFGPSIALTGRFEPDTRADELIAVGAGEATITASAFENYDRMAKGIAAQVLDDDHRDQYISCKPVDKRAADQKCARQFIESFGRFLFRRPLKENELAAYLKANADATALVHDFYAGLRVSLAGLLSAPQFLYRQEQTEPDNSGARRLTGYGMASRLSFLLWNSVPDNQLLNAAAKGELKDPQILTRQIDRMLASPRLEEGVRAFFEDMLAFDNFDSLDKDSELYPAFSRDVANDAREQTLRTIVDHLLSRNGDYRDLFTTGKTFLTPRLGTIYGVAVETPNGLVNEWTPYNIPAGRPQAGILTQASFLMLYSHPGRSSPTLRGKALREKILCQRVPDPPANVNFSLLEARGNEYRTARQRLDAHTSNPACAGCHKIMDPIGLALENFDTISGYRAAENGAPINASGRLDGITYTDAAGLGAAVHDNPQAPTCFVRRLYAYAVGRQATQGEGKWLDGELREQFSSDGYRVRGLLRRIALSPQFYRVTAEAR